MISYEPLYETLKKRGITTYKLINEYGLSRSLLDRLRHNKPISTVTINDLCTILSCDVSDVVKFTLNNNAPGNIYSIAGLNTQIEAEYPMLKSRIAAYREKSAESIPPSIKVKVTNERIIKTVKHFDDRITPEQSEYILAGGDFYRQLLSHNGIMLHSSAVVTNGKAYMFSAPSGTGKSTHTALWLKMLEDAYILNDDKPAIRVIGDKLFAFGTPFSGKHDISRNTRVEIGGICFIKRSSTNSIRMITAKEAIPLMLAQTMRFKEKSCMENLLDVMDTVIRRVPVYELSCNTDISAAELSYRVMAKGLSK